MARVPQQPLFSGTVGNLIFYTVGGKQYVRSKPAQVKQPNSPAQLLARDKFRQSSRLAKVLSVAAPILGVDETRNQSKSAYHTLLGVLRTSPFKEGSSPARWLWPELKLREGSFPEIEMNTRYHDAKQELRVCWNPARLAPEATLLLTVIPTESLKAGILRPAGEKGEITLTITEPAACYACVVTPGANPPISGSLFVWEGGG